MISKNPDKNCPCPSPIKVPMSSLQVCRGTLLLEVIHKPYSKSHCHATPQALSPVDTVTVTFTLVRTEFPPHLASCWQKRKEEIEEVYLRPEVLDQKLAHITSGTVPCTHMSASNLLLWKMRIMDFGREVAASLSFCQGIVAFYLVEECQPN